MLLPKHLKKWLYCNVSPFETHMQIPSYNSYEKYEQLTYCTFYLTFAVCFCSIPCQHTVCVSVMRRVCNLLQITSASSEPSAHSASPSQRHLAGRHCPLLQAKSVVAHVFFPVEREENCLKTTMKTSSGKTLITTLYWS